MDHLYDEGEADEKMDTGEEIDEETASDDPTTILTNSSPQIQQLLIYLKEFSKNRTAEPMKGLIFVERRYTARILCHIIRRYANANPELNLRVDFMTGRNAFMPDCIETMLSNKNNNKVLDKFKRDEIQLIVATSVLEEGIDLQECNLVISYDVPKTFRSYVQQKGRARMKNSSYVIMTPIAQSNKLQTKAAEWRQVNKILKEVSVIDVLNFMKCNRAKMPNNN